MLSMMLIVMQFQGCCVQVGLQGIGIKSQWLLPEGYAQRLRRHLICRERRTYKCRDARCEELSAIDEGGAHKSPEYQKLESDTRQETEKPKPA